MAAETANIEKMLFFVFLVFMIGFIKGCGNNLSQSYFTNIMPTGRRLVTNGKTQKELNSYPISGIFERRMEIGRMSSVSKFSNGMKTLKYLQKKI